MSFRSKAERSRSRAKPLRTGIEDLFEEYCSNSSVHGVRYFTGRERSRCERYWWVVLFLFSVASCGWLIGKTYRKWSDTPVIVSFDDKTTPVWKIPLPAVTICQRTKANRKVFDFPKEHAIFNEVGSLEYNRTDEYLAMLQLCDRTFDTYVDFELSVLPNKSTDKSYVSVMNSLMQFEFPVLEICKLRNEHRDCQKLFCLVPTEEGICYTLNGLSPEELLRNESSNSRNNRFLSTPQWTLEEGYSLEANYSTYPYRTVGSGSSLGISILLYTTKDSMERLCSGPIQGFKVLLHSPADYPQLYIGRYIDIPVDQNVMIAVKPQIIQTAPELRNYSPERRQCFFNQDRQLRFFYFYTQDNCKLECLANYTFQSCGCVKFSMIFSHKIFPVCETNQVPCMRKAEDELLKLGLVQRTSSRQNFREQCNCLPACTSIQYDVETVQNDFDVVGWGSALNISRETTENENMAFLTVYYKEAQFITSRRSELYGVTDFIANCGGLLGLFMGTSLLSVVELCYYCSVRPIALRKKWSLIPLADCETRDANRNFPLISIVPVDVKNE